MLNRYTCSVRNVMISLWFRDREIKGGHHSFLHSFLFQSARTVLSEWAPMGHGEATTSKTGTQTHFLFPLDNFKQGKQLIDWKVTLFIFLLGKKCEILPSPKAPKDSGAEIYCLWCKTKTTVFAFCFHKGIKTQWPLAIVQATTLPSNHL